MKGMKLIVNIVIVQGLVITKPEYKFIYNKFKTDQLMPDKYNHISILKFNLRILNNSILAVYCYDEVADYVYAKIELYQDVVIVGNLTSIGRIELNELYEGQ